MKSEPIMKTRHAMELGRTDSRHGELITALEAERDQVIKERDKARDDADDRFAHSDHKSAKYYRMWRKAEQRIRVADAALEASVRDADRWKGEVDRLEAELTRAQLVTTKEAAVLDDSHRED